MKKNELQKELFKALVNYLEFAFEEAAEKDINDCFIIGEYYYFFDDFKEQDGFVYGKLVEISTNQEVLPYCVQLPNGTQKFWYSAIRKELPVHLLNTVNNGE